MKKQSQKQKHEKTAKAKPVTKKKTVEEGSKVTEIKHAGQWQQAVVNIGMVGHVDHGKTSLTQALTGKWTDTHSEELKRGISIKLGYADTVFFKCIHGEKTHYTNKQCTDGKAIGSRTVSFVDAPGHETLMTTMLSGAALMHGAVLVIAANEFCPQPQTEEHLMALKISGIKHLIVAQNKIDLVDKEQAVKNNGQINELLKKYGYEGIPVIPVTANFGTNLDLLIEAIETMIPTPVFDEGKPLKMYCSRSFDINKPGTLPEELKGGVFGGSIVQGKVKPGDKIELGPGIEGKKLSTTVVSVSTEKTILKEARPGGLIAIATSLDPSLTQSDRMRGQVIEAPATIPEPTNSILLEVNYLDRLVGNAGTQIKSNDVTVLTIGTMTIAGNAIIKSKNQVEIKLRGFAVIEKNQRVAISKKDANRWRLIAYGVCK